MTTLPIPTETAEGVRGPAQGSWTYADWEQLPDDGKRYEIIEGVLYVTTAPSNFHQWVISRLITYIGIEAERSGYAYWLVAPIGLLMPGCDPVQPDFMIVRQERAAIIRDRRVRGVPDLIVEVISPGSAAYDEGVKLEAYARAHVPEYAVIDPAARVLRLYTLAAPEQYAAPREYAESETLSFACLPHLTLNISDLFAHAPDTTL